MKRPLTIIAAAFLAAFLLFGCATEGERPTGVASGQDAVNEYLKAEEIISDAEKLAERQKQAAAEQEKKVAPADLEQLGDLEPPPPPPPPPPPAVKKGAGPASIPIIMYHQVRNDKSGDMIISKGKLEEELAYLKREGYYSVSPSEWLDYCDGRIGLPQKCVILTFDDGWKSQYQNAVPLLEKYGFRGVFYVYPDFVGGSAAMNWKQIQSLAKRGHTVGCHSMTHPKLTPDKNESDRNYKARIKEEIIDAKKVIEEKTGISVTDFCFPYGYYSEDCFKLLDKAGFETATTVNAGQNSKNSDPYLLSRYQVNQSTSLSTFASWLAEPYAEAYLERPGDGARTKKGAECRLTLSDELLQAWRQGGEMTIRCNHEHPQFRQDGNTLIFRAPKDDARVTCAIKIKARDGRTYRRSFFFTQGK
ncbi:polysaccharide deacetylase family protein [bacterium]|nr:polysaccharide deacetylase family protein [bacterium]